MTTEKYNESDFSGRLKKLRGSQTQGEFARFLGIQSQQTYANYENGRVPKAPILQQIAQRAGVDLLWLMTGTVPRHVPQEFPDSFVREEYLPSSQPVLSSSPSPPATDDPNEWEKIFTKVIDESGLDWLLDRLDQFSKDAADGDTNAAIAVRMIMPRLRARIDALKSSQPNP